MPASSRSRSPTWLPISTPACPAARQRSSSAQAASGSCSGTWQNGTQPVRRAGADLQGQVVEDRRRSSWRPAPLSRRSRRTPASATPPAGRRRRRPCPRAGRPGPSSRRWIRRNSRDPTMIIASRSDSIRSQAGVRPGQLRPARAARSGVWTSMAGSHGARSALAGVQRAAVRAGAGLLVVVERLEHRRQVLDDVAHLQLDLVHQRVAVRAVPLELLQRALLADPLDDEADRAGLRALRRVRRVAAAAARSRPRRMCTVWACRPRRR